LWALSHMSETNKKVRKIEKSVHIRRGKKTNRMKEGKVFLLGDPGLLGLKGLLR